MGAYLLAGALSAVSGCTLRRLSHKLAIFAISALPRSHEVLVDGGATVGDVCFEGVRWLLGAAAGDGAATVARLDRRANSEGLDDRVANDVGLVEEAGVVVLARQARPAVVVHARVQGRALLLSLNAAERLALPAWSACRWWCECAGASAAVHRATLSTCC